MRNADLIRPADESLTVYVSALRQDFACGRLRRMYWVNTLDMLADGLTKGAVQRDALLRLLDGCCTIMHEPKIWRPKVLSVRS